MDGDPIPRLNNEEITHRAPCFRPIDSARQPHWEELPMERNAQEESKAHLMATSEEFRQLAGQHSDFARKLDDLESLPHLTEEQQLEETRLKKLKLRLKDQMEAIVSHSRAQQVA
jgi:uncharacterized protein YdcH (DUF465 family)